MSSKLKLSNAVIRRISGIRLEGVAGFDHDADAWFDLDPGDDTIDFTGSKITKASPQCMSAVGSNCNKPQNALARNQSGSLKLLGVEALDQVPPIRC